MRIFKTDWVRDRDGSRSVVILCAGEESLPMKAAANDLKELHFGDRCPLPRNAIRLYCGVCLGVARASEPALDALIHHDVRGTDA